MYSKILVALDATGADESLLKHVANLAKSFGSEVVLLHVADGWAARWFGADAVSPEVNKDRAYLERMRAKLMEDGIAAEIELAFGEPADHIIRGIDQHGCDLLAMTTHGHKFLTNALFGVVVDKVRRTVRVPVFLVRAE